MSAATALADACAPLAAMTLQDVLAVADLQTRVDRKYLVPGADFARLVSRIAGHHRVLEIGERRAFAYESAYFDTPDLQSYHRHAYGRRRRFKVRTRSYLDSAQTVLEVKCEGGRGQTVKERYDYRMTDRFLLDQQARAIVASRVQDADAASALELSLVTRYRRTTLVDESTGSRLTCDTDLEFADGPRRRVGPADLVLVESKTVGSAAVADKLLWRLGYRPVAISKYCAGLAMLDPRLPAHRWNRTLRRHFGWQANAGRG